MKTVIKLILIDLLVTQIIAPILIAIPCSLYQMLTVGTVDQEKLVTMLMIPAQLTGQILMLVYLWKAGYISKERTTWSPVSPIYLFLCCVAMIASNTVVSALSDQLKWLPDIMEQSFDILRSGWGGLIAIAVVGPVFEELLFRGAITKILLKQYNPTVAVLISALFFGVFHINPAQIIPAFLLGILLAWTYVRTQSLIPCMLMHILNNTMALWLTKKYPDAKYMDQIMDSNTYLITVSVAAFVLIVIVGLMIRFHRKAQQP